MMHCSECDIQIIWWTQGWKCHTRVQPQCDTQPTYSVKTLKARFPTGTNRTFVIKWNHSQCKYWLSVVTVCSSSSKIIILRENISRALDNLAASWVKMAKSRWEGDGWMLRPLEANTVSVWVVGQCQWHSLWLSNVAPTEVHHVALRHYRHRHIWLNICDVLVHSDD